MEGLLIFYMVTYIIEQTSRGDVSWSTLYVSLSSL